VLTPIRNQSRPIGMFDSGFGGLTVARAVIDLLPDQDLVYFGDTGRYPYGPRPQEEVRAFSLQIARYLRRKYRIKLLVVACNTASAAALAALRRELDIPVVGVIDPGLRAATTVTRTGRVGVIGTVGTIGSGAYEQALTAMTGTGGANGVPTGPGDAPGTRLSTAACPGLVEFVERGETGGESVTLLVRRLLAPLIEARVDTLLLGCTHYPYLARVLSDVMGREVVLVSSADETAFEVRDLLVEDRNPGRVGRHTFVSSGDSGVFETIGRRLFGAELVGAVEHRWDTETWD